jgi:hypothetical protein
MAENFPSCRWSRIVRLLVSQIHTLLVIATTSITQSRCISGDVSGQATSMFVEPVRRVAALRAADEKKRTGRRSTVRCKVGRTQ